MLITSAGMLVLIGIIFSNIILFTSLAFNQSTFSNSSYICFFLKEFLIGHYQLSLKIMILIVKVNSSNVTPSSSYEQELLLTH